MRARRLVGVPHRIWNDHSNHIFGPFGAAEASPRRSLAFLIGAESSTTVSRLEQLKRLPNLAVAFACRVIFDTSAIEIFPGLFSEIKEAVQARANELYQELQGDPSACNPRQARFP